MRAILIQIPAKQRRHEDRHDGDGPAGEARQLGLQSQQRLIGTVAIDCEIGAGDAQHRADLRGDALFPRQALAEHHRLAGKYDGRARGIHGLGGITNAITGGVEDIVDGPAANRASPSARRGERPPECGST